VQGVSLGVSSCSRKREREEGLGKPEEVEGQGGAGRAGEEGNVGVVGDWGGEAYRSWISSIFWSMTGCGLVFFRLAG
jgi:hypothetical protein